MKNRIFSVLLVAAMLASMIVMPVNASGTGATPDWSKVTCPCGCGKTVAQLLNDSSAWTAWSYKKSTSGTVAAGHYYINDASTTDGVWTLTGLYTNQNNVLLDLRGNTLNAKSSGAIEVSGGTTMTLIDTVGGGQVSSYVATVTVAASGVFNAYNCTLRNHRDQTSKTAATLMGADGVSIAYLENCTIIGNQEQTFKRGSAIAVLRSNFTLKNCEVIGAHVTDNGGAIHITHGSVTIDGGSVTDGSADGAGNGIWINNGGTVTIKGGATVGSIDVGVSNAKIVVEGLVTINRANVQGTATANSNFQVGELNSNSRIGVMGVTGKALTTGDASAYVRCFRSLVPGYAVVAGSDGKLMLDVAPEVECIAVVGLDGSETNYTSVTEALENYDLYEDACLKILELEELELTETAWIDVNGCDITVTGNANVTANFYDSANDDGSACGNVTVDGVSLGNGVSVDANGKKYCTIYDEDADTYSFHALDMAITSVALATSKGGMYYYATYYCDDTLAANISSYGINYELYDAEGANKIEGTNVLEGYVAGGIADPRTEIPICRFDGVLAGAKGYTGAECGEMKIVGTPYVNINGEKVTGNSVGKSMKDLCDMLDNAIVNNVDASYLSKMLNLMNKAWQAYDLSSWTFNSIKYEQGVWVENKDNQAPVEA